MAVQSPLPRSNSRAATGVLTAFVLVLAACGGNSGPVPTQGEWLGEQVGFHLEDGELSNWWVLGMYCEGDDLTAIGGSTCVRVPSDASGTTTTLAGSTFSVTLGDLVLQGTFVSDVEIAGTWRIASDSCCTATGSWSIQRHYKP